jgi:hypothetical protein
MTELGHMPLTKLVLCNSEIEIRRMFEGDDFGEVFTPELRSHSRGD